MDKMDNQSSDDENVDKVGEQGSDDKKSTCENVKIGSGIRMRWLLSVLRGGLLVIFVLRFEATWGQDSLTIKKIDSLSEEIRNLSKGIDSLSMTLDKSRSDRIDHLSEDIHDVIKEINNVSRIIDKSSKRDVKLLSKDIDSLSRSANVLLSKIGVGEECDDIKVVNAYKIRIVKNRLSILVIILAVFSVISIGVIFYYRKKKAEGYKLINLLLPFLLILFITYLTYECWELDDRSNLEDVAHILWAIGIFSTIFLGAYGALASFDNFKYTVSDKNKMSVFGWVLLPLVVVMVVVDSISSYRYLNIKELLADKKLREENCWLRQANKRLLKVTIGDLQQRMDSSFTHSSSLSQQGIDSIIHTRKALQDSANKLREHTNEIRDSINQLVEAQFGSLEELVKKKAKEIRESVKEYTTQLTGTIRKQTEGVRDSIIAYNIEQYDLLLDSIDKNKRLIDSLKTCCESKTDTMKNMILEQKRQGEQLNDLLKKHEGLLRQYQSSPGDTIQSKDQP